MIAADATQHDRCREVTTPNIRAAADCEKAGAVERPNMEVSEKIGDPNMVP